MLEIQIDDESLIEFKEHELPCEKKYSVFLSEPGTTLSIVESLGESRDFELSSEQGWIHLSARVQENGACQVDCLVSESEFVNESDFAEGRSHGIRFQPFFLVGSEVENELFKGRGLFRRGMHHPGTVSPGNLSLACLCDSCGSSFRIRSLHTGLAHKGYFYSDSGKYTLLVPDTVRGCPAPNTEADPAELEELEHRLPPAPDGTTFSYFNPFRCPHCSAAYIDFENFPEDRKDECYANVLFGEETISWEE